MIYQMNHNINFEAHCHKRKNSSIFMFVFCKIYNNTPDNVICTTVTTNVISERKTCSLIPTDVRFFFCTITMTEATNPATANNPDTKTIKNPTSCIEPIMNEASKCNNSITEHKTVSGLCNLCMSLLFLLRKTTDIGMSANILIHPVISTILTKFISTLPFCIRE